MPTPSRVTPGEPLRASRQNELVDAVIALQTALQGGLVGRYKVGLPLGVFKIMDEGPDSEADYADERYWVKQIYVSDAAGDHTAQWTPAEMTTTEDTPAGLGLYVTATNLAELADNTHDLADGEYAHVYRTRDSQTPGVVRYFFTSKIAAAVEWTRMPYSQKIDDGGVIPGGGFGAGFSAMIHYTNGVQDGEQHVYYTWAFDAGTGLTIAQTFQDSLWLKIGHQHEIRNSLSPGATQVGDVDVYVITAQFDWTTLAWGAPPASAWIGQLSVLTVEDPDVNAYFSGVYATVSASGVSIQNIHGIKIVYDKITNPVAGVGNVTWGTVSDFQLVPFIKRQYPDCEYISGVG